MKVIELNPIEFDKFALTHEYANPWQTSNFGEAAKTLGYDVRYLGFEEGLSLVGATLLLSKVVYLGQSISYAPRGILVDYENPKALESSFLCLKKYLVSKKIMSFTMDPPIILSIRNKNGTLRNNNSNIDKKLDSILNGGDLLKPNTYAKDIINLLMKRLKFEFRGQNLFFEGLLPRWYAITNLPINTRTLLTKIDKRVRTKLRKAAKLGVEIVQDQTKDPLKLYEVIGTKTGKSLDFYKQLLKNNSNIEIYYAIVNSEKYVNNSKALYERELERNDILNKILQDRTSNNQNIKRTLNQKKESDRIIGYYKEHLVKATSTLRDYPVGRPIAVSIVFKCGKNISVFEEMYDSNFSSLNGLYLLRWKLIEKYSKGEGRTFNFGAITGGFNRKKNPYYGINQAKLALRGTVLEYIGEFGIMTNKSMYNLYLASVTNRPNFKI